jgi:hypothetical protein
MSKKKIVLNEDHLALIRNIKFEKFNFNPGETVNHHYAWGVDEYNLFGGTSFVLEAIAVILGQYDKFIPGTEEDPMGRQYPKELESYWWSLYRYIWDNLEYIMSLVLYSVTEGGLTPGMYQYDTDTYEWKKVGD